MYHLIILELHRQSVAQWEREAEVRRQLPTRERGWLKRFVLQVPRSRRRAQLVARAAPEARTGH
jgi:hypothetical protein